jgi:predicted secreted protein
MNPFTGILVYVIVWWVVLFMVLPWGVRREQNPEKGNEVGAPANPMIARKLLITSIISVVIWVALYFLITRGLLPIHVS